MDEIEKAKEKAEIYLNKILKQSWISIFEKALEDYDSSIEKNDWCLRFEAYSYLGHRYENLKNTFAFELRELWDCWTELSKKGELGTRMIFWPIRENYIPEVKLSGKYKRYLGNEIENHVSMFRVKEILELNEYETYFIEAKRRIEYILLKLNSFLWWDENRIFRQIVRCPNLKSEFLDHLKISFRIITDAPPFKRLFGYGKINVSDYMDFYAMALFFLSQCDFKNGSIELAKKALQILAKYQSENGSFNNNILTTCLIANSIHITKADPSNIVCNKAINWILEKQFNDGCWNFLHGWSTAWKILSTVIVLETMDLITNDNILPIWALKTKPGDIYQVKKHPRIQIDNPLPVSAGINWQDVTIRFISDEEVEIRAGKPLGVKNFIELGFKDRRSDKSDLAWNLLKELGKHQGEISLKDTRLDIKDKVRQPLKDSLKVMRPRLRFLFKIEDDPFYPYDRKREAYRTKFKISYREVK